MSENPSPVETVSLRLVTKENLRDVCKLSDTLSPAQQRMVASNAYSVAEASFYPTEAWFRTIYLGEAPIGFAMLYMGPFEEPVQIAKVYYLWRFMVAGPYQGKGYGRQALLQIIDYVRSLGAAEMHVSVGEGEASPEPFYRSLGFERNGLMYDDEIALVRKLA